MENSFLDRFFKFVFYQPLWIHILICAICVWGWIQLGRIITRKKIWQYINVILFMGSLGNIIWQTLLFRKEKVRIIRVIPLLNLITSASTRGIMRSMLMNVFLFVPFGMTMPFFLSNASKKTILTTILCAVLLSLFIESAQYIFALGKSESDDLICNMVGALIGCLIYWNSSRVKMKCRDKD